MRRLMIISSVLILFLALGGVAAADLVNGGFESSLTGWTVHTDGGGSAFTTTSASTNDSTVFTAVEGSLFAVLSSGGAYSAQTLSQTTVFLNVGDILSGFAAFDGRDYWPYNDRAFVMVNDDQVWSASIGSEGNYGHTAWESWAFTATTAGNYTLTLGVVNWLDSAGDSRAFFDANIINSCVVPLPGAVWLLGSGLVGLLGFRRLKG